MKYEELILTCIDCVKTFNANKEGPDSHSETFLKNITKETHERMFIKQILYGVLRYSDFLKVFTENLFHLNKSSTERKDETLFQIFAYISIFRLEELPLDDYRQLVNSQDAVKMNVFFKFLFNIDNLNNVLRPEWINLYDMTYVDTKLISGLNRNNELLNDLLTSIMSKAQAGNITSKDISLKKSNSSLVLIPIHKQKKQTIPEPFNLTQPKPKTFQAPIAIPNKILVRPMPYEEYQKESLIKLEQRRKDRLELIKDNVIKKYEAIKPFELETAKRPTNIDKIKKQVEEALLKELEIIPFKSPKDFTSEPANVKFNEAAIFREEFLIQKKKKQEEEELDKILIEKTDNKEFERWRREMDERDNLLRAEEIQKRKLELELNREVAVDSYNQRMLQNKYLAAKHKEEEQIKMKEKSLMLLKELDDKRRLVKETDKERENVIEEKEKLIIRNQESHQQQLAEIKDHVMKVKEEKRIEEERRKDIIRQIRELEKLPVKRTKGFDPTETPGLGLLEEMSLAELRERLDDQKAFVKSFLEAKREDNKIKIEERNESIITKAKTIADHRDKLRNKKEVERKMKMESNDQMKNLMKEIREKNLFEVKEKIEKKKSKIKKEEEIFEKKIREINLQRQYLQQGKAVVEEKAFKQIEDGLERKINDKQNKDLIDQELKESVKWGEIKIRYGSAKHEVKAKQSILKNYESTFQNLKNINQICLNEENEYKSSLYQKGRQAAEVQKGKFVEKHKYSLGESVVSSMAKTGNTNTNTHMTVRLNTSSSVRSGANIDDDIMNKLEKEMM